MAEAIPWEVMRDNLHSFSHDSISCIQTPVFVLEGIPREVKAPELNAITRELRSIGYSIAGIHAHYKDFRARETSPSPQELAVVLKQYKRALRKRNQNFYFATKKLGLFYKKNEAKFDAETKDLFAGVLERLNEYKTQFPAEQLGRRIDVELTSRNIYAFIKRYAKRNFVDRDNNPVKIVFRGKNIGEVSFDRVLLARSLNNLLTDALNHSPGRPIFITLGKKNGRAVINVTNHGPKLLPAEIAKIGKVRFTRAWQDPKRGYGKMSVRMLTEAQGGNFTAANSMIGPMLSIKYPMRRRVA